MLRGVACAGELAVAVNHFVLQTVTLEWTACRLMVSEAVGVFLCLLVRARAHRCCCNKNLVVVACDSLCDRSKRHVRSAHIQLLT